MCSITLPEFLKYVGCQISVSNVICNNRTTKQCAVSLVPEFLKRVGCHNNLSNNVCNNICTQPACVAVYCSVLQCFAV